MSFEPYKPTERKKRVAIKWLAYGASGSGKTLFGLQNIKNAIILDSEEGLGDIEFDDSNIILPIREPEDRALAWAWILENGDSYETIIDDSLSKYAKMLVARLEEQEWVNAKGVEDKRAMWNAYSTIINTKISDMITIDKNIYVITREDKVKQDDGYLSMVPDLPGQASKKALPYEFDIVAHYKKTKDEDGKTLHVVDLVGSDDITAKNRFKALNDKTIGQDAELQCFQELINLIKGE